MAQNLGVAGTEIVKFNKVMTDLTGMTFDQATATAQAPEPHAFVIPACKSDI